MGTSVALAKLKYALFAGFAVAMVLAVAILASIHKEQSHSAEDMSNMNLNDSTPPVQLFSTLPPQGDGPWMHPFLPSYAYPTHYDLWLYPDFYFDGSTYIGRENITITFTGNSKYILVHYKMMTITITKVYSEEGNELEVAQVFAYDPNEFWVTELVEEITSGSTVVLHLEFEGSLTNDILGYYKSTYTNQDTGVESWLATTKFQPVHARKAFPNFEEPKYKANFTISQYHWKNFTALSNMPNISYIDIDDIWRETHFETTPKMSSYLVCFIVCDFVYIENTLANGKPHRLWTSSDKIHKLQYALRIGKEVADFMEVEYDMEYHLPKLDQLAIPDYPSGATEHWGIITYRESRFLYDEKTDQVDQRETVSSIVAHELAHNYFGNIVTCEWWDDIWLNEGFASYYGDMSLIDIEPEFEMEDYFVITTTQPIMRTDAYQESSTIITNVTYPDEVIASFSGVLYSKGAAFLRMIETAFGKDALRDAIRVYLKRHQYGTVVTDDFWQALQEQVGPSYDIATICDPWLLQMGFPVINITESTSNELELQPSRFLNDPDANPTQPPSDFDYEWYVPVTHRTTSSQVVTTWLNMSAALIADPRNGEEWIKFNHKQSGFYRVNYPRNMWNDIAVQLQQNYRAFESVDRANILDDAINLARALQLEYTTILDLTLYMEDEMHYFPWRSSMTELQYISLMLHKDGEYSLWRAYMQTISSPVMEMLEVNGTGTYLNMLNRKRNIITISCGHGYIECLLNTTELFLNWIDDETYPLLTDIRRLVYRFGMEQTGGDTIWNTVWDRYIQATGTERDNLAYCLAWTDRQWLIDRYLQFAMDPTIIPDNEFFDVIEYIAANTKANGFLWEWTRANYQALIDRFGLDDSSFADMVPDIVEDYNTELQLQEVQDFYRDWPHGGAAVQNRLDSIASIQGHIEWMGRNRDSIVLWLTENV